MQAVDLAARLAYLHVDAARDVLAGAAQILLLTRQSLLERLELIAQPHEGLQRIIDFGDLRAATGLGLNWASPIGPMKISLGFPVRKLPGDRVQRIQFQVGTGF